MKKRNFNMYVAPVLMVSALGLGSCNSVDDDANIDYGPKMPEKEYFDFATSKDVSLDLDFGEIAARSLVSVYVNEPADDGSDEAAWRTCKNMCLLLDSFCS